MTMRLNFGLAGLIEETLIRSRKAESSFDLLFPLKARIVILNKLDRAAKSLFL